ncbi:DUF1054 family protein [Convivina praedatoris]|uniref:Uncharacterized protein n=1 Tax=Convivina praedatoris TaxID=2880963 RepID=A0ABM9D0B2_9LACO|nr:DUF1054 family protein [Convivina sp. LMG 32447]CAH1850231.1 hypothetical protein R078138_00092 [Convivina sp. LMG 32447]CAH1850959.1 hypothetical protein LMG032447_00240 [Convivina sp. LMG 32447]CAH1850976.1 hypothetical protein R077815_00238 [Convivina sp. LMG 32447]
MFTNSDFDVFLAPDLEGRMEKIRTIIDPKFEAFATKALPILKADGQEWYAHVAKHRMRKTNAPDNTWVAFAPNKRGYKMMPHFELGMWADNLYLYLAVEENMKPDQLATIAPKLREITDLVAQLSDDFVLSQNHMVNENQPLAAYEKLVERYQQVKASEILIGIKINQGDVRLGNAQLEADLLAALKTLLPLYQKLR